VRLDLLLIEYLAQSALNQLAKAGVPFGWSLLARASTATISVGVHWRSGEPASPNQSSTTDMFGSGRPAESEQSPAKRRGVKYSKTGMFVVSWADQKRPNHGPDELHGGRRVRSRSRVIIILRRRAMR
jgi:hypothetical protein